MGYDYTECFKNHEVQILTNNEHIQQFRFKQPNTGEYMMEILFTGFAIYVSGDCGELVITPGYGRGIGWFRGSVHNDHYFLQKISRNMKYMSYDVDEVPKILSTYLYDIEDVKGCPEYCSYNDRLHLFTADILTDPDSYYNPDRVYEEWFRRDLGDEPPEVKVLSSHVQCIYAGLKIFADKLDEMDFKKVR